MAAEKPYLDTLNPENRSLVDLFLQRGGIARVEQLFQDSFRHFNLPTPRMGFRELQSALQMSLDPESFALEYLDEKPRKQLGIFRDDVNCALGETFIEQWFTKRGIIDQVCMIPNTEVYAKAQQVAAANSCGINPETLRTTRDGTPLVLPDLMVFDSGYQLSMFDFLRIIPSPLIAGIPVERSPFVKLLDRFSKISKTLRTRETCELAQEAISVKLPISEHIRFKVVTAQRSPRQQNAPQLITEEGGLSAYFDNSLTMNIKIAPLAIYVLNRLAA